MREPKDSQSEDSDISVPRNEKGNDKKTITRHDSDSESDISVERTPRDKIASRNRHYSGSESDISVLRRERNTNDGSTRYDIDSESDISVDRRRIDKKKYPKNSRNEFGSEVSVKDVGKKEKDHHESQDDRRLRDPSIPGRSKDPQEGEYDAARKLMVQDALKKRKMKDLEDAIEGYTKGSKQLADEQYENEQIQAIKLQRLNGSFVHETSQKIQREGDPLKNFTGTKNSISNAPQENHSAQSKRYTGVLPRFPNRFGLEPGYHWDGNDRSNGFEQRLYEAKEAAMKKKHQQRVIYEQYDYDD